MYIRITFNNNAEETKSDFLSSPNGTILECAGGKHCLNHTLVKGNVWHWYFNDVIMERKHELEALKQYTGVESVTILEFNEPFPDTIEGFDNLIEKLYNMT